LSSDKGDYLRREYEDLRREYEDLRREYEDLRRPFALSADVPYVDTWTFKAVQHYPGKHPCEKPVEMLEHILRTSTKPGAVVLDAFCGSGSLGVACLKLGRRPVLIDKGEEWCFGAAQKMRATERDESSCEIAVKRIERRRKEEAQMRLELTN
jgi:site-specific DNA-methyltransferase (adenine-specific)